jgi:hypothetical protein
MTPRPHPASPDPVIASTVAQADAAAQQDRAQLALLRAHRRAHRRRLDVSLPLPVQIAEHLEAPPLTRGQRLADGVAATIGSWRFIALQSTAIVLWIAGNALVGANAWDPLPLYLAQPVAVFSGRVHGPGHHDEPEPPVRTRPPPRPNRLRN